MENNAKKGMEYLRIRVLALKKTVKMKNDIKKSKIG